MRTTYRDAMRAALREALQKDARVFLMGEDVGRYGGTYAVSKGLLEEFGPERIRDTPLSESTFVGAGIGAAMAGMRPIVEVMTVNFSMLCLDQIVNNAATLRHMSGGQVSVPLVIRMATGAGRQVAAQHSHSLEGWYAHIPGIKVLAPATLEDARGMLWTALEDPDPVVIFEHATLYNMEGELADDAGPVDIVRAAVRRQGRDVSIVSHGGTLGKALAAADALAREGIDAEVIDLRVLRPLDMADGVIEEIRVAVGAKVPVGTVLAMLRGKIGAAPPGPAPVPALAVAALPVVPAPAPLSPGPPPGARGRVRASPAARSRARELGLDPATIRGTGPEGAVTVADVEAAARRPAAPPIRQAIAAAMSRSNREIPHYYLGAEIELSRTLAWLARENERRPVTERLLLVALLLKAVARAAREVPDVNGHYVDGAFRPADAVHLGVAISLRQGGLVAPALHDVEKKAVGDVMRELNDLVARARRGGLRSSELADATLTVTSLGDLGVATVYGVIYPPQVALVGFGRVQERPWASGGQIAARPVVSATLAGDHRVSDGIRGGQFLATLDRLLQAPESL